MPIQLNCKFVEISRALTLRKTIQGNTEDWIVWWFGPIYPSLQEGKQPKIEVLFRRLLPGNEVSNGTIRAKIPITCFCMTQIGTVWKNGSCKSMARFDIEDFDIEFTDSPKLVSFANRATPPFPDSIHHLSNSGDQSWLLEFSLPTGGRLLIPCMEFFSRCYGSSAEVKRVLTTYPWINARDRLYTADTIQVSEGELGISQANRTVKADGYFITHAKHDDFTKQIAKKIYTDISIGAGPDKQGKIYLQVKPWFMGPATVRVEGIWFDDHQSFLALRVTGCSAPPGGLIKRSMANSNKAANPAPNPEGKAWDGTTTRRLVKPPDSVEVTGDANPDHGGDRVEIQAPSQTLLGDVRPIIDVVPDEAKDSAGQKKTETPADTYSGGESEGSGKGVGHASIHSPMVLESQGMLRDMWNALLFLKKTYPAIVRKVEWYTKDDGFNSSPEPRTISMKPFDPEINRSKWPYFDPKAEILRGVLVARVTVTDPNDDDRLKFVYLTEIQRRLQRKKKKEEAKDESSTTGADQAKEPEAEETELKEQSFSGTVFTLNDDAKLDDWLKMFLSEIRLTSGRLNNSLLNKCPGDAHSFQHSHSQKNKVTCQSTAINALSKVGVVVTLG